MSEICQHKQVLRVHLCWSLHYAREIWKSIDFNGDYALQGRSALSCDQKLTNIKFQLFFWKSNLLFLSPSSFLVKEQLLSMYDCTFMNTTVPKYMPNEWNE